MLTKLNRLLTSFCSSSYPCSRITLISNEIVKYLSVQDNTCLINLNNLENIFRSYSWYIDKKTCYIYKLSLVIDGLKLDYNKDNTDVLNCIETDKYINYIINLSSLNRSQYLNNKKNNENIFCVEHPIHMTKPQYYLLEDINKSTKFNIHTSSKKRKRSKTNNTTRKKPKKESINWGDMVAPTHIRDYMLGDPLLYWLYEYRIESIYDYPTNIKPCSTRNNKRKNDTFIGYILKRGLEFEEIIVNKLRQKWDIVKVAESFQARDEDKFNETVKYMKLGIPIIYQAVLHDYKNKLYGCPDLLVRSDYINRIFGYQVIPSFLEKEPAIKLETEFHYIIVDIKHSTLKFNSDGLTLRNSGMFPVYKGQLFIYNQAIGEIQGYLPECSFILSKISKLGMIDFINKDKYYREKVQDAIDWVKLVRTEGHNWELVETPSRRELYPNMKNEKDGRYKKLKKELSEYIDEITSIWYCSLEARNNAHDNNIYKWSDRRCTSELLGFKQKKKKAAIIDRILNINRQNVQLIDVNTLPQDNTWKVVPEDTMEFYLDYETLNTSIDNDFIFMKGIGWEENGNWNYKSFYAKHNTHQSELEMVNNFIFFVNSKTRQMGKYKSRFVHWYQAEPIAYKKLQQRHHNIFPNLDFYDLHKLFLGHKIVVKGAKNFSLKPIAKAMNKNGLIKTNWDTHNLCSNGLNAMFFAYKIYSSGYIFDEREPIVRDIIHYNEIDCKVLWDILSYLRENF